MAYTADDLPPKKNFPNEWSAQGVNFRRENIWQGTKCQSCHEYRFSNESASFCCLQGKFSVHLIDPPMELKILLPKDTKYIQNSRYYDNSLSLASLGLEKPEIINKDFSPSLNFQGQFHHLIGSLKQEDGESHRFAQLYVHDGTMEDELDMRIRQCKKPEKTDKDTL